MRIILFLVFLLFAASFTPGVNRQTLPAVIRVQGGFISGTTDPVSHVISFKGIPFAAPPVGDLRWKPPQPVIPWQGVKTCSEFGPSPVQPKPVPFLMLTKDFLVPAEPMGEDCLYLNVWTAAASAHEKRPVLLWIYGGGFNTGGAAAPAYDGSAMAAKGCVFVSFNYRLGIFGFFSHPELSRESPTHSSGNYGLLDQIAALKWVHENIAAFGGDPGNVTIAGQSAGSMSVNCLLASPLARGLFHRAIAESGTLVTNGSFISMPTLSKAEQAGMDAAKRLHAASIEDLRKISAHDLFLDVIRFFGPVIDGYVLPQSIPEIYAAGKQAHLPLLTGWNGDEGMVLSIKTKEAYTRYITDKYGQQAAILLRWYPAASDSGAAMSQLAMSRDRLVAMPHYEWATLEADAGNRQVFVYNFTRKPPRPEGEEKNYGAFHTAEIPYALDNLSIVKRPWQEVDHTLATMLSAYWINFAKTGNPNGDHLPYWPAYNNDGKNIMILDESPAAMPLPNQAALDFFKREMGIEK